MIYYALRAEWARRLLAEHPDEAAIVAEFRLPGRFREAALVLRVGLIACPVCLN
jgi:hypothetical protein